VAELNQDELVSLLGQPIVGHLVTIRGNGRPHVAPIWYLKEGDHALIITGETSLKVRNIRRNPAVALSIATERRPYQYAILEGDAEITQHRLAQVVEQICIRYDGPERGPAFAQELLAAGTTVLVDVGINRVISWKED
jgi:PPOX class probable F420-dependent enzyme